MRTYANKPNQIIIRVNKYKYKIRNTNTIEWNGIEGNLFVIFIIIIIKCYFNSV